MIRTVAETGSTNDDMAALARAGAAEGLWLRAERQSGGRGRQGRGWHSPAGNLYASTLVRLRQGDPPAATLALVAAVALHEVAAAHAPLAAITIKWPNDLLAIPPRNGEGVGALDCPRHSKIVPERHDLAPTQAKHGGGGPAKLAGILLERFEDSVVIGFGANLAHHPEGLDRPATDLAALAGAASDPASFLEMLAERFGRWLARWRAEGVAPIRDRWLKAAHPPGTALSTPQGEGLFEGLDEAGALRLRLADGTVRVIHAGDVFLI